MMPNMDEEEESTYFEYLGRFVHTFSLAEALLFKFLVYYTGVSDKTARAVFSGVRAQDGISFIRRLMEIRRLGQKRKADLDNVLAQFAKINDLRNHLLHYQWSAELRGVNLVISNDARSLSLDRTKEMAVSREFLKY